MPSEDSLIKMGAQSIMISESKKYGFYFEEYEDGTSIETLMTGDGLSVFTDAIDDDGIASINPL